MVIIKGRPRRYRDNRYTTRRDPSGFKIAAVAKVARSRRLGIVRGETLRVSLLLHEIL